MFSKSKTCSKQGLTRKIERTIHIVLRKNAFFLWRILPPNTYTKSFPIHIWACKDEKHSRETEKKRYSCSTWKLLFWQYSKNYGIRKKVWIDISSNYSEHTTTCACENYEMSQNRVTNSKNTVIPKSVWRFCQHSFPYLILQSLNPIQLSAFKNTYHTQTHKHKLHSGVPYLVFHITKNQVVLNLSKASLTFRTSWRGTVTT